MEIDFWVKSACLVTLQQFLNLLLYSFPLDPKVVKCVQLAFHSGVTPSPHSYVASAQTRKPSLVLCLVLMDN